MLKAFLFDLDGTLWDSKEAIVEALQQAVAIEKGKKVSKENLVRLVEQGSPFEVLRLYRIYRDSTFWREYRKRYNLVTPYSNDSCSIFQEVLRRNRKLGIATSLKRTIAFELLSKFNLLTFFPVVITPSETRARKPSPRPILIAINRLNVHKREAIYIGDQDIDMIAARNAGCYSGLAEWGNRGKISIRPDYKFKELSDIIALCGV